MDDRTKRFLDKAQENDWISEEQIQECLKIYETVREVGVDQPLEEILVKKKFLTPDQANQIRRELAKTKVGKYQIIEKLGEGGAGIVYKANQEHLERIVAVKVLSKTRASSPEYLERFAREARIAVTLNHENIVRGLDYGEAEGYQYFVMEYVEGQSLYEILTKEGTLAERRALEITLQTVAGLRHAAQYDLVHRDIKPENILITSKLVAKLCDLGLAKPSLVESAQTSKDGTTIGTPTYMSPEQIRGKDDADFRADVYSLGVTLFHMVAGRPPFSGESADIVVRKHLREPPPDPRLQNPKISSATVAVIMKMLAKSPDDRYSSLDNLAEDLQSVLEGRPPRHTIQMGPKKTVAKMTVDLEEGAPRHTRKQKKSAVPFVIGGLAVVAAAVVFLVVKPFGEDKGDGGTDVVVQPDTPSGPTEEDKAENLFREAQTFATLNPDAALERKSEMFDLVVKKFPDTRWAVSARMEIQKFVSVREEAARRHIEEAEEAYDRLAGDVDSLVRQNRFGEAVEKLTEYPESFEDTEFPAKLSRLEDRLVADAAARTEEVLKEADGLMKLGRYDEAAVELAKLKRIGIVEHEDRLVTKGEEVVVARAEEERARASGEKIFSAVVGAAYLKAADGAYRQAEADLVAAGEREDLAYFRSDLDLAWKDLREAARFVDALEKGGEKMAGGSHRLDLISRSRPVAAGKVLGATREGLRMARGGGEELIKFDDLAPVARTRIAFEQLDMDSSEDHGAAALYLVVEAHMEAAKAEIEAARILGRDPAPLTARMTQVTVYLSELAEDRIKKAEVRRVQKRYEEARDLLREAVMRAPWLARARFLNGAVLVELGEHEEAAEEIAEARALGEKDPDVRYFLARALDGQKEPEQALKEYQAYVSEAPKGHAHLAAATARIEEILGKVLKGRIKSLQSDAKAAYRRDRWDEVIDLYSRLYELAPKEKDSLYYIGRAYVEKGDYLPGYLNLKRYLAVQSSGRRTSDARRELRILEKNYKENLESSELLEQGRSEYVSGRYVLALELFNKAVTAGPLNLDAYYNRAMCSLEFGKRSQNDEDFEAALADFGTVAEMKPDEHLVNEGRALAYFYLDRENEALESALVAIEKLPSRWSSYNIAGLVHHRQSNYDEAVKILTTGIKRDKEKVPLYINRALAFEALRRYDEAESDLAVAMKWSPAESEIQQVGRIRERLAKARKGN